MAADCANLRSLMKFLNFDQRKIVYISLYLIICNGHSFAVQF